MQIDIYDSRTQKQLGILDKLTLQSTILDVKNAFQVQIKSKCYSDRQSFRSDPKGKSLKDDVTLESLGFKTGGRLYFKDLGPQLGWSTVFLSEYAGPIAVYLIFYFRPACIYGLEGAGRQRHLVVDLACLCWCGHYLKRILETLFVHRFSHATMPIFNLFKNCSYYWGFTAWVAYFVNHPLYTSARFGTMQIYGGLALFLICELGNLSTHIALRNLRPPGTKVRRIPRPSGNPFTFLFNFVSCPNYTYEIGSWFGFSIMTQTLTALLFTTAGFYQMAVWALGKHANYKKEFKDYPRGRKAIVPLIL